jgi:hypothetical protein
MERIIAKHQFLVQQKESFGNKKKEKTQDKNTVSFPRVLQKIGLVLTAISGAFIAVPIQIPSAITAIAAYLGIAGTMVTAIGKIWVDEEVATRKNIA